MKQFQKILISILILTMVTSVAFAGDYAHFHFIGFSKDGKYLAFEEYGTNDDVEDDSPYSVIYIVNVNKNDFAALPLKARYTYISPLDKNGQYDYEKVEKIGEDMRAENKRRASKQLKRFGIIDGNTGLQVAAHLINEYPTDYEESRAPKDLEKESQPDANANISLNQNTSNSNSSVNIPPKEEKVDPLAGYLAFLPQKVSFTKAGNALYRMGFFEINIKPVPITQKNCDKYERDMFSFEMTLKNESGETKLLQKAGKVPKNRGCVDGYGIQEAFLYHKKLAIFVGIFTRGWEGENLRLMAVTGELND